MAGSTGGIGSSATGISFGGLASGVDTTSIIQKIMQFESRPLTLLDGQISSLNQKQGAWTSISASAAMLLTAAQGLNDASNWRVASSKTSDATIASATAVVGATAGQYVISPDNGAGNPMALAEQNVSADKSSQTNQMNLSGRVYLGLGANPTGYIDVATTDSLANIATKINAAGLGVTASVIQTATSTYKLQLMGNKTGADNRIHYNSNGTGVLDASGLGLVSAATGDATATTPPGQAAQDAKFKINGISFASASNTVTSAIPNVTLTLSNLTASNQVTITNASDTAAIEAQVKRFVDGFNSVANSVGRATGKGGVLQGNSSANTLLSMLSRDMTQVIPGLGTTMNNLSQMGISLMKDGALSLDSAKFQKALADNPAGVQAVFNTSGSGISQVVATQLTPYTQTNGLFDKLNASLADQVTIITKRETAMKLRLQQRQQSLTQQFTQMEQTISRLRAQGDQMASALGALAPQK